jgi:YjbE family integral membrane protein
MEALFIEVGTPEFWSGLLKIIIIDLLLSGDNAVVIALACRNLPPQQQKWGIIIGAGAAVVLRILFASFITVLMLTPYLKLVGGVLLWWIAIKMVREEHSDETGLEVVAAVSLWNAIRVIAVADAAMSLDNVIAIAGAAKDSVLLIVLGLLISIPLIVAGSTLVMKLMTRYPVVILIGGMLLGYVGGDVIVSDPAIVDWVNASARWLHWVVPAAGVIVVAVFGWRIMKAKPGAAHG